MTSAAPDAVDVLRSDHRELERLFEAFDALCGREASPIEKSALAEEICLLLTVHLQLEEEIFYPAVRPAVDDETLMDEAHLEHTVARALIAQISATQPSQPLHDTRLGLLGESFEHHVRQHSGEMFPRLRRTHIDLVVLAAALRVRRGELLAEYRHMLGRSGRDDEAGDPVGRRVRTG